MVQEAGHFQYHIGKMIENYEVVNHLVDGTFGRALLCQNIIDSNYYVLKVIRSVKEDNEMALEEIQILDELQKKGADDHHIVGYYESFIILEDNFEHICMVFEPLGLNLRDFMGINRQQPLSLH